MVQLVGMSSCTLKGCEFESCSGTYLGCGFDPWSEHIWEAANRCLSLTSVFLSLSLSLFSSLSPPLPLSLKSINISLPWLVWLSRLNAELQTKGLQVQFPVRAHAWVAATLSERQLLLSFSFPCPLSKKTKSF